MINRWLAYFEEPLSVIVFHADRLIDGIEFVVAMASVAKEVMALLPRMGL